MGEDARDQIQGIVYGDAACRLFEAGLGAYLEGESRPQVLAHAGECRFCGVVLSDLRLPEGDGFGVLRAAKELDPELPVIVMTAYSSIQDAVRAIKDGALDFLSRLLEELVTQPGISAPACSNCRAGCSGAAQRCACDALLHIYFPRRCTDESKFTSADGKFCDFRRG